MSHIYLLLKAKRTWTTSELRYSLNRMINMTLSYKHAVTSYCSIQRDQLKKILMQNLVIIYTKKHMASCIFFRNFLAGEHGP